VTGAAPLAAAAGGLLGWAAAFAALYGLQGLGCALGWPGVATPIEGVDLHRATLVATWLLGLAIGAAWWGATRSRLARAAAEGRWLARLAVRVATVGLVAQAVSGMPVLFASQCGAAGLASDTSTCRHVADSTSFSATCTRVELKAVASGPSGWRNPLAPSLVHVQSDDSHRGREAVASSDQAISPTDCCTCG
jgi:hypothetical protein